MSRKLIGKVDHIVVTLATLWACIDGRLEKGEAEVQKERGECVEKESDLQCRSVDVLCLGF